jgi:hypothetical protein
VGKTIMGVRDRMYNHWGSVANYEQTLRATSAYRQNDIYMRSINIQTSNAQEVLNPHLLERVAQNLGF